MNYSSTLQQITASTLSLVFVISIWCLPVLAQRKKRDAPESSASTNQGAIAAKTAGMQKEEGFFTYFYDSKDDKIYLEIDMWDTEFLYVHGLPAGVGSNDIGLDRGQLGGSMIVRLERHGPKILMIQPNYTYRALSDNPEEVAAVRDAFAESVIWGFQLVSEEDGRVLVDASSFLLRDAHDVEGTLRSRDQGTYKLDASRSAFYLEKTRNFPENTEFEAILTFTGTPRGGFIRSVTPSPESVTVRQHHSFVQLPDDGFKPRKFDPRAGYFGRSYMDYATPISQDIVQRFIVRHRLEKVDPEAAISDPVEPIVYYLDPGTPEPIRSALLDGARWWNQAFESAGYRDAFKVEVLPAGADPMDVRYNVINWVHRSTRGWSYGSSVVDPRTGEIIKGHVTLGSLRVRQDFLIAEGLLAPYKNGEVIPPQMEQMALARLRQLSAHEVGHTLGLAHNYSSSMDGRASVMDYPHPVAELGTDGQISLSNAYDDKIGAWDKISIQYGYQDFPEEADVDARLNKILEDGYKSGLSFISDQDARPSGGAHPRAHLWDNGTDAAQELNRVLGIRSVALKNFGENNIQTGQPFAELEEVLVPVYFFHRYQVEGAVKLVGGLDYTYALRGDWQNPVTALPGDVQSAALAAVLNTISPDVLAVDERILGLIPPRPIGYRRSRELIRLRTGLTFDPIGAAETASNLSMSLLFHPARATRLVEHHSRDSSMPSLQLVIDQTLAKSWKMPKSGDFKSEVGRTVDMVVLRNLMSLAAEDGASVQARAITHQKIMELDAWMQNQLIRERDEHQKAHLAFARAEIRAFGEDRETFKNFDVLSPPAGSPIGGGMEYCSMDY